MDVDVNRRLVVRVAFLVVLLAAVGVVGAAALSGDSDSATGAPPAIEGEYDGRVAVTSHGATEKSKIVVYDTDGEVAYLNATYDRYFDVDPVEGEPNAVTYTAAEHVYGKPCGVNDQCSRNVIEKLNLTTGETEVLFQRYRPSVFEARWHDADRVSDDQWVIADIAFDRVMIVNTTTGETEWGWNAQEHFEFSTGKAYPEDWTHINDVEVVRDGQIMVSVRNQDRVVFLERGHGVVEALTLGEEDNYDILNEQHNPDYIPESQGGPAIVVGDSHNNRVVEYQRVNGTWEQSWMWTDARMAWPRDADRLPGGSTLVTDSNGNRLMELARNGSILWSVSIDTPYEAEMLGTGDESTNGTAAAELDLESNHGGSSSQTGDGGGGGSILLEILITIRRLLPSIVVNAVLYVLPTWVGVGELIAIATFGATLLAWAGVEYRWSDVSIDLQLPVRIRR
jgi:hypothetical protein